MWKVLKKFWTEFDVKLMASDELLLIRRLKIMSMGLMDQLPEQYPDDLVKVPIRTLATALGIPSSKIRLKGLFLTRSIIIAHLFYSFISFTSKFS